MNKDMAIAGLVIVAVLIVGCVQLGIYSGRQMQQREDSAKISDANARADRLGDQLSVLQKALGKLAPVKRLKQCESSHRKTAVGDGGMAYGEWQFWETTFRMFEQEAGLSGLEYKNPLHQDIIGAWALANGKGRHWTCYGKTGHGDRATRRTS